MRRLACLTVLLGLAACQGSPGDGNYVNGPSPGIPAASAPGYVTPAQGYAPSAAPVAASGYPPGQQPAAGTRCYAGVYTCNLPQPMAVGAPCSCPGRQASNGNVH